MERSMRAMVDEKSEDYLTPEEVAEITRKHINTIYRWIKSGELKAHRPGGHGHYLIHKNDLKALLETGEEEQHEQ
jgi:excisionase family DNA binding protein